MRLRSKTLLFSGVLIVILIVLLFAISQFVFLSTYSDMENRYSYHVLKDEITQLNSTISAMDQTAQDWAQWDDAYSFVSGNNPVFIKNNLPPNIFTKLNLNLILFVDNNGKIVYGKAYDLQKNQEVNIPISISNFTSNSSLLQHNISEGVHGVITLPEGPMIIISRPILTSNDKGPVKGTLIMGRNLTREELISLSNIPNSTLSTVNYNDPNKPADFNEIFPLLSKNNSQSVRILGPDTLTAVKILKSDSIAGYAVINDIYGNPAFILKSEMARTLYESYLGGVLYFVLAILLVGLLFMGITLRYLDNNILSRLEKIMGEIVDIGKNEDLKQRITVIGNDELSELALSINNTLNSLQKSEQKLEESEKKYRRIFENTGTAMIITDENMTISMVNTTFERILGIPKDEIEGKLNWGKMVASDYTEEINSYHKSGDIKNNTSEIVPKTYEVLIDIKGDEKVFFATFDFIPGTMKSLISLIDISDRKKAENLLKRSLREKELLLREIHHRVKNSLQIISSLLSLQAAEIDDDEIIERYKESENRIQTIALVHDILYQSTEISNINFKEYIEVLVENLLESYQVNVNCIETHLELGDFKLGIETAIPAGLIINELVSNSVKHGFKENQKGKITVKLEREDGLYTLTISDNGIGIPDDYELNNTTSLGLQLVNALVNQLEGKIDVEVNDGTIFRIIFKELEYRERM